MNFSNASKSVLTALSALTFAAPLFAAPPRDTFSISTAHMKLSLAVDDDGRLYEQTFGSPDAKSPHPKKGLPREAEFLPTFGSGFILEPAIEATHADGNTSTDLNYVKHNSKKIDENITLTDIELQDRYYPFYVTIHLKTYAREDMIEAWTEIHHSENAPVTLWRFASFAPVIHGSNYWLTHFYGDWANESHISEEKLGPGLKIIDSKLGVRATQHGFPSFLLSVDEPASENSGSVFAGSLKWSGSYQLGFEVDWTGKLRALAGINPFASQYHLAPGEVFTTPGMLWTWSDHGKGQVSRNFHDWARRYGIRDGSQPRPILLNNWEATYFDFNEEKLVSLMAQAKKLGCELFLLDDGWFANKFARNGDHQGLGDWSVNTNKLPHGLGFLADAAGKEGVRFGIWMEPEMVNPKSELYEQHPDWAITEPHRDLDLRRNQLDLDLGNPVVKDYAWSVINGIFGPNPGITYTKWDANRFITQPGSSYLKPENQSHIYIDYVRGLYDLMAKLATNFPHVGAMLCSGGGGRADYGALQYFHSFWPSDNTDPLHRVFIQWGYSYIFPANAMRAHVTRMGHRPLKFALDVALSADLGFDMDLSKTTEAERKLMSAAIALDKEELRPIVGQGDLFRLESPNEHPRSCLDYVSTDKSKAVLFVYQINNDDARVVKPEGLDPGREYTVREVNLPEGVSSSLPENGRAMTGAALMKDGLMPACKNQFDSAVIELSAAPQK